MADEKSLGIKKLKRNLTKAIKLALPGARIDWSQGDLSLLGEGPVARKRLAKSKLAVEFQLQRRMDCFEVSARIMDGDFIFVEYGTIAYIRERDLHHPAVIADEIADSFAVELHGLAGEISGLGNLFRSSLVSTT